MNNRRLLSLVIFVGTLRFMCPLRSRFGIQGQNPVWHRGFLRALSGCIAYVSYS